MTTTIRQWRDAVLASPARIAIPVMTHPGVELLGRSVREAVSDAGVHAAAVKRTAERFPTAAATMIMDLSVEAEAFGAELRFEEHDVPTVMRRCVSDGPSVEQLRIPSGDAGRLATRHTAVREALSQVTDRPLFAECIGPVSLAARLFDVSEIMIAFFDQPDTVCALLEKCTAVIRRSCLEFKSTGAHGVIIAEPVAGLLSPDQCEEFSSRFVRQIVDAVQDETFMVILHNCGDTEQLVGSMLGTGAAGLHFGNRVSMRKILPQIPSDRLVGGNLDPVSVLLRATPVAIERSTRELLAETASFPNFFLSSGCDVPPRTPLANIDAMFTALERFNRRAS